MSDIAQTLLVLHDATEAGSPHVAALREQLVVDFERVRHSAWKRVPKWLADNERWGRDPHEDEDGEAPGEVVVTCRNLEQHLQAGPYKQEPLTTFDAVLSAHYSPDNVIASVMREHPTLSRISRTGTPHTMYLSPNTFREYQRLFAEPKPKRPTLRASLMAALDRNAP